MPKRSDRHDASPSFFHRFVVVVADPYPDGQRRSKTNNPSVAIILACPGFSRHPPVGKMKRAVRAEHRSSCFVVREDVGYLFGNLRLERFNFTFLVLFENVSF